jgi:hypothetical protein
MRMARTITLVLLGGGVMLGGAAMLGGTSSNTSRDRQRECQEARAANRPDAEQICASARSSRTSGGTGAWFLGRSLGGPGRGAALAGTSGFRAPAQSTSSRGGFGSTARGFSSSGS